MTSEMECDRYPLIIQGEQKAAILTLTGLGTVEIGGTALTPVLLP